MTEEERHLFFNENFDIFDTELEKRRRKWQLHAVPSLDFSDIKQIILFHIFKKVHLYDKLKSPLPNWTNSVISAQISNLLRNNYYNMVEPCAKCACAQPNEGCELYSERCDKCPIFKHWMETKKSAYNVKLPVPQENHLQEIFEIANSHYDISEKIEEFHVKMKTVLKGFEYKIYECLFILNLSEEKTAKKLGYTSKEPFKYNGYASIAKTKKVILVKAKKLIEDGEIDLI